MKETKVEGSDERHMTVEQGYQAMFLFLDDYFQRTGADEIGGLLGVEPR